MGQAKILICTFFIVAILTKIKAVSINAILDSKNTDNAKVEIKWDKPVLLKELPYQSYAFPSTVYYDPVSGVNHLLYFSLFFSSFVIFANV